MAVLLSCYRSFRGLAGDTIDTIVLENLDCLSYTIYSWDSKCVTGKQKCFNNFIRKLLYLE